MFCVYNCILLYILIYPEESQKNAVNSLFPQTAQKSIDLKEKSLDLGKIPNLASLVMFRKIHDCRMTTSVKIQLQRC